MRAVSGRRGRRVGLVMRRLCSWGETIPRDVLRGYLYCFQVPVREQKVAVDGNFSRHRRIENISCFRWKQRFSVLSQTVEIGYTLSEKEACVVAWEGDSQWQLVPLII